MVVSFHRYPFINELFNNLEMVKDKFTPLFIFKIANSILCNVNRERIRFVDFFTYTVQSFGVNFPAEIVRSEERRVGKECRVRGWVCYARERQRAVRRR